MDLEMAHHLRFKSSVRRLRIHQQRPQNSPGQRQQTNSWLYSKRTVEWICWKKKGSISRHEIRSIADETMIKMIQNDPLLILGILHPLEAEAEEKEPEKSETEPKPKTEVVPLAHRDWSNQPKTGSAWSLNWGETPGWWDSMGFPYRLDPCPSISCSPA